MAFKRRLTRVSGTLGIAVGVLHLGVAVFTYERASLDALWFSGSGVAVLLIGALTLLGTSDRAWRSLEATALVANLLGLALAFAFAALSSWREPQGPILIAVFASGALGSIPGARRE